MKKKKNPITTTVAASVYPRLYFRLLINLNSIGTGTYATFHTKNLVQKGTCYSSNKREEKKTDSVELVLKIFFLSCF